MTLDCNPATFPKGGPGKLIFVLGPSGIGKSSMIARRQASKPVTLHKERTYECVREHFPDLITHYDEHAMSSAMLVFLISEEIERRRRGAARRKRPFIVEMCGITRNSQAVIALICDRWQTIGGEAQVVCLWPGTEGGDQPDDNGYLSYLTAQLRENPDDEALTVAFAMMNDFSPENARFCYPWENPLLRLDEGYVTGEMVVILQDWYKTAMDQAAAAEAERLAGK